MTRHLGVCLTRRPLERGRRQKTFWLFVEAARQASCWLYLESPLVVRLSLLGRFLRDLWPEEEMKGTFVIAGRRYEDPVAEDTVVGESTSRADALLGAILTTGLRFTYVCKASGALLWRLTVVGQQERAWKGRQMQVLAHSLSVSPSGRRFS